MGGGVWCQDPPPPPPPPKLQLDFKSKKSSCSLGVVVGGGSEHHFNQFWHILHLRGWTNVCLHIFMWRHNYVTLLINKVERQFSKKNLYARHLFFEVVRALFFCYTYVLQFEMRQVSQLNVLCVSLLESGRPYMVNYNAFCIKNITDKNY